MEILHIVVRAVCEDRKVDLLIAVTGSLITADHINFGIEDKSDGNCYGF